jgi:anti-anti-sigma factor
VHALSRAGLSAVEETVTGNQMADRPGRLSVERKVVDGVRVVTVQGEIDHDVKDVLSAALLSEDGTVPPPRIVVDLSGVTFMDSSGINVFVAAYQQVSGAQGWARIAGAQDSVLRVLQLVGVDTLIPCHPTIEQALSA